MIELRQERMSGDWVIPGGDGTCVDNLVDVGPLITVRGEGKKQELKGIIETMVAEEISRLREEGKMTGQVNCVKFLSQTTASRQHYKGEERFCYTCQPAYMEQEEINK